MESFCDVLDLCEVGAEIGAFTPADEPVDPRFLCLDGYAEGDLLGVRLGELVGGELVGKDDLVLGVRRLCGLEVDHRQHAVQLSHEVDNAHHRAVEACSAEREQAARPQEHPHDAVLQPSASHPSRQGRGDPRWCTARDGNGHFLDTMRWLAQRTRAKSLSSLLRRGG